MESKILVIEDDDIVARTISRSLRGTEFEVLLANGGTDGLSKARSQKPDLVILDIIMPGMDGYKVCKEMRSDPDLADVPILFLTAKIKDEDKIAGFKAGADDYLCKPFNIEELILRVRAILRRARYAKKGWNGRPETDPGIPYTIDGQCLILGPYQLDTRSFELETPDRGRLRLTPLQYDLLYHLMSHPGEIFSPARLLDEVWDYPSDRGSPDLVRVHIKALRDRVESDPSQPTFICTVPGLGYTIQVGE